jgi:2-polyprenyl-6-methoxyphenol hydroxylase-like FAD-dependent oxidoreductase
MLATRLAQLGHDVVLVEKLRFPRPHIGESLTPSIIPLFEAIGLKDMMENSGFFRPESAMVHWAGEMRDLRKLQPGFQVDRARFDAILLEAARASGVRILQPAQVRAIEPGWRLTLDTDKGRVALEADLLADATGRANLSGGRRLQQGEPLLALWAYHRKPANFGIETRVESGEEEWFWGAPLPDGSFNAAVLVDPARLVGRHKEDFYEEMLGRSRLLSKCASMRRISDVAVCDATPSIAEELISRNSIKVGESAFSIDPLSSQGVQTAMGSSLHASMVLNTFIRRPQNLDTAMKFYDNRQREAMATHRQGAMEFYRDAAAHYQTSFWQERGVSFEDSQSPLEGALLPVPDSLLMPTTGATKIGVPCARGDFIEEVTGLWVNQHIRPMVFLGGIEVVKLWDEITWPIRASQLVARWTSLIGLETALMLLSRMWVDGFVRTGSR